MDAKELRTKSPEELLRLGSELRGKIRDARFKIRTRQSAHVRELRALTKELARVETMLAAARQTPSAPATPTL